MPNASLIQVENPDPASHLLQSIQAAERDEKPLRIQRSDGERILARVLGLDGDVLLYAVSTSTHPERYGVCDSTGFRLPLREIESAALSQAPPPGPLFSLDDH